MGRKVVFMACEMPLLDGSGERCIASGTIGERVDQVMYGSWVTVSIRLPGGDVVVGYPAGVYFYVDSDKLSKRIAGLRTELAELELCERRLNQIAE